MVSVGNAELAERANELEHEADLVRALLGEPTRHPPEPPRPRVILGWIKCHGCPCAFSPPPAAAPRFTFLISFCTVACPSTWARTLQDCRRGLGAFDGKAPHGVNDEILLPDESEGLFSREGRAVTLGERLSVERLHAGANILKPREASQGVWVGHGVPFGSMRPRTHLFTSAARFAGGEGLKRHNHLSATIFRAELSGQDPRSPVERCGIPLLALK